jgi:hypothetical protein
MKKFTTILLLLFAAIAQGQTEIPLYEKQLWEEINGHAGLYQMLNTTTNLSAQVMDGDSKIRKPYDIYYEFPKDQQAFVERLPLYNTGGTSELENATVISYSTWAEPFKFIEVYRFWQSTEGWEIVPINANVRFLKFTVKVWKIPKFKAIGRYNIAYQLPGLKPVTGYKPLKNYLGFNGKIWDVSGPVVGVRDDGSPIYDNAATDYNKLAQIKKAFTRMRMYVEKDRFEIAQGVYEFAPTSAGGWNYDRGINALLNNEVTEVIINIKELPVWQQQRWHAIGITGSELAPVNNPTDDKANPESYTWDKETALQIAYRYGSKKVDAALLKTTDKVSGLNYNPVIELNNEQNLGGANRHQFPAEYIANIGQIYDAIKAYDPTIRVSMQGLAGADIFYLRGLIRESERVRGFRPDGSVNVPFDIINYHCYQNNQNVAPFPNFWLSKSGSPESTGLEDLQNEIEWLRQQFIPQCEIYQTETGYDSHPQSMFCPIPFPDKSSDETVAALEVRTALLYAATSVGGIYWFMALDHSTGSPGPYETSGLWSNDWIPRLKTIWLAKTKEILGNYTFARWISRSPRIAEYDSAGVKRYAAWHETTNGISSSYSQPSTTFKVFKLDGSIGTQDAVTITETPLFFDKINLTALPIKPPKERKPRKKDGPILLAYPNPAITYIISEKMKNEAVAIYNFSGSLVRQTRADGKGRIELGNLPAGCYTIMSKTAIEPFIKQ